MAGLEPRKDQLPGNAVEPGKSRTCYPLPAPRGIRVLSGCRCQLFGFCISLRAGMGNNACLQVTLAPLADGATC